ncbi:MAG: neutral zinc metallopeptidase [bacterium]|nr:neutral zinc metallopeptidase [bacterium]
MKWLGRRGSSNVDDRRGLSGGGLAAGGGVVGVIVYLLFSLLGGGDIDPSQLPNLTQQSQVQLSPAEKAEDDKRAEFVKVVLAETEDVWKAIFSQNGQRYEEPVLVLYRESVRSGCGGASSATGPFYCPLDHKLYIDLSFYQELQDKYRAPGDFAMAYVVAHEVGHHVQQLLGTAEKVQRMRQQVSEKEYNRYSVMLELQADFFAGLWAHHTQKRTQILEPGDVEEALNAASAIGDDRLQRQSTGRVTPDAFTHGTSAQRMYWFKRGWETGDVKQGDTFKSANL